MSDDAVVTPEKKKREREEEAEPDAEAVAEPPAKAVKTDDGSAEESAAAAEAPAPAAAADDKPSEEAKTNEATAAATTDESAAAAKTEAPAPAPESAPAPAPETAASASSLPPGGVPTGVPAGLPQAQPTTASGAINPHVPATLTNAAQLVEETGEVSSLYVGRVIGKGGEMIRDLQARSGCRIDVDQSVPPGQPRIITYRGTRKTVDFAKRLVQMLCNEHVNEADLPLGEAKREIMAVPATSVGKIIGRGGEMIRELQSRSHAKIQVDHNNQGSAGLPPNQKRLTITGTEQSVTKAQEMVNFLVANPMMDAMQALTMLIEDKLQRGGVWGSGPPYVNLPNMGQAMMPHMVAPAPYGGAPPAAAYDPYGAPPAAAAGYAAPAAAYGAPPQAAMPAAYGGSDVEIFYAAKNFMGRIIGQKGVTINDLQKRSGCDIQINQEVPHGSDCEISLRGPRQGIESAKQMLREIIEIGPNHPYAGGGQSAGGGGGGGYGGGYGQDPYAQQPQGYGYGAPAYGGYPPQPAYGQDPYAQQPPQYGYGQPPQQAHMYGAPAPAAYGGMPPQQAYGGYSAPPPPVGASPWKSATAGDGQVYYYNEKTGETQWEKPPGMP